MPIPVAIVKWSGTEDPAEGSLVVTSLFTDGAVGDTTTYEDGLGPQAGSPCGALSYRFGDAWITGVHDFGSATDLSSATWQFTCALTEDSLPVACSNPDPGNKPADTLTYEVSYATIYGVWTVLASGIPLVAETIGGVLTGITARYVRVRINYIKWVHDANGALGIPIKNTVARISDFRVSEGIPDDIEIDDDYEEEEQDDRCAVSLSWTEAVLATAYELERRRPSSDWSNIYTGAENAYTDSTAEIGQDYYYRVRATNGSLVGDWSETLVASSVCQAHWDVRPLPDTPASAMGRRCRPDESIWRKSR